MTDTYNDTTGSRKKFLIPLVVLLLCAVSLTGAGYAYNSSVSNDGTAPATETFVIDLYTAANGETAIVDKIAVSEAAPLVLTTEKTISDDKALEGKLQYDGTDRVLYTGYFKMTKAVIENTQATLTTKTVTANVVSSDPTNYAVGTASLGATLRIYQGDSTSADVAADDFKFTIGDVYCFEILIADDYESTVGNGENILDAKAYAATAISKLSVEFTLNFVAEPVAVSP